MTKERPMPPTTNSEAINLLSFARMRLQTSPEYHRHDYAEHMAAMFLGYLAEVVAGSMPEDTFRSYVASTPWEGNPRCPMCGAITATGQKYCGAHLWMEPREGRFP